MRSDDKFLTHQEQCALEGMYELMDYVNDFFNNRKKCTLWSEIKQTSGARAMVYKQFKLKVLNTYFIVGCAFKTNPNNDCFLLAVGDEDGKIINININENLALYKSNVNKAMGEAKRFIDKQFA